MFEVNLFESMNRWYYRHVRAAVLAPAVTTRTIIFRIWQYFKSVQLCRDVLLISRTSRTSFFSFFVYHHFHSSVQPVRGFTLSDLLDKLSSQVSSLLPPVVAFIKVLVAKKLFLLVYTNATKMQVCLSLRGSNSRPQTRSLSS